MAQTIFSKVDYNLGTLITSIELGELALPDIQRPFVWSNAKVRNLFDSMYRGYPVGYFLFWKNALAENTRNIGDDTKQKQSRLLIVDGQQRLTSLYAVMKGVPIVREDFSREEIQIAFNPLTEVFDVADAAIRNNNLYIPNISALWGQNSNIFKVVSSYLESVRAVREISDEEQEQIQNAIQKVNALEGYPLTAIELSSEMDEEDVAEVFVRINSEGKQLNQADFILTLMSVYWEEGRRLLEHFCRDSRIPATGQASAFNHYIQPDPDQLLRVAVGLAFRRARLKYVYAILRGKDLETEKVSDQLREQQFENLKAAQEHTLNLQHWHDFLKVLRSAGFRGGNMISSKNAIVYTYTLYLIGKVAFSVDEYALRRVLAQWFFMASLTGRYSSSPESKMEFDLAQLRDVESADEFCRVLRQACNSVLTPDYWEISLPGELATAAGRSPTQNGYFAALNLLDATVLFSNQKVADLLDPSTKAKRSAIEKHHLFPKKYLATLGITTLRRTNQLANYGLVEWGDNSKAAAKAPEDYLPYFTERFSAAELERMYYWHALPEGWESMQYERFLVARRERMAVVIKEAYLTLSEDAVTDTKRVDVSMLVAQGESDEIEFKSTLRMNLHTGQKDPRMEHAVLKAIAGFLNRDGGKLVIGVDDDGEPLGLDTDGFPSEDKMNLHLVNLINAKIGKQFMMYISPRFEDYRQGRAFVVNCEPSRSAVFLDTGKGKNFFVRTGASTSELAGAEMQEYVKARFV